MNRKILLFSGAALLAAGAMFSNIALAAEGGDKVISDVMKKYHKAPKGTDPVCKKVGAGTASDEEVAGLLKGYEDMSGAMPPKGDEAEWKKKCAALVDAVKLLQAKDPKGAGAFKKAVNCKACHTDFRKEKKP